MDLIDDDTLEREQPGFGKSIPAHIEKHIKKYNDWVKKKQKILSVWRPRPWRTGLKTPFRFSNIYFAKKQKDIDSNPEIKKMDKEAVGDDNDE